MIDRIDDVQRIMGRVTDGRDPNGSVNAKLAEILGRLPSLSLASVQTGTIAISGATSNTATITNVDTTKSAVFFLGSTNTTNEAAANERARVALTNGTTVTATVITAPAGTVTVGFIVVTFSASVSVQSGTVSISAVASATATITSVNTARAWVIYEGYTLNTAHDSTYLARLTLTNGTTVTATRTNTGGAFTIIGFTVVEM